MKNKGFTLIELLAVIFIIAVISTIVIISISNNTKSTKERAYDEQIKRFEKMANLYLTERPDDIEFINGKIIVTLEDLYEYGYIDNNVKNPLTGEVFDYVNTAVTINKIFGASFTSFTNYNKYDRIKPLSVGIFGSADYEFFNEIDYSPTNGIVVVGDGIPNFGMTVPQIGTGDGVIIRFDEGGNPIWKRHFGGSGYEYFSGVEITNDSYISVGAGSSSNAELTGISKGSYDGIIVKTDFNGNLIWNKNYGGTSDDRFEDVAFSNDNEYVAVGKASSTNVDLTGLNKGLSDAIIVKYDSNGNVIWKKNYGGTSDDKFTGVAVLNDDTIIATGYSTSPNVDLTGLNKGGTDAIIVKYSSNGTILWKSNFGGTGTDYFFAVEVDSSGNIYAAGSSASTYGTGDLSGLTGKGGTDAILVKYDTNGNILWKRNIGGTSPDEFYSIKLTANNDFILSGWTSSTNLDFSNSENFGSDDCFVAKYDSNGNYKWNYKYGDKRGNIDYCNGATNISNGAYMAVGYSVGGTYGFSEDAFISVSVEE